MADFDGESLLRVIKKASFFEIFLISFLSLPFVFNAWLGVADKFNFLVRGKIWTLVGVLFAYGFGVYLMFLGNSREKRLQVARDQVVGYLTGKTFSMISYERVRANINSGYSDTFLDSVITAYPETLRRAILKGHKPGIAYLKEELEST